MRKVFIVVLALALSACEFYYLDPALDYRARIVGSHDVDEYSETYNDKTCYTIYIGRLGSYDKVYIDNFYGVDIRVDATLRGDKIDIYWQRVDGYEVEGVGTVYGDEIHFNYKVRDVYSGTRSDYCEAVAWRY